MKKTTDANKQKQTLQKETNEEKLLKSRRGFFKDAALGMGGVTLLSSGLTSCQESDNKPDEDGKKPLRSVKVKNGAPPAEVDNDEWFAPKEVDLAARRKLKSNPIKSNAGGQSLKNLYLLDVDRNVTNSSTGQSANLFAYNGSVPGPTFRIRGDQDLSVILINSLGGNNGYWAVKQGSRVVATDGLLDPNTKDWQIDNHLYGPHQQHVTNLHTHGLHVSPGVDTQSQEATEYAIHSDNVLLRVIPVEDYENRVLKGQGPALFDNEQVGEALYKFHLPRPDGTPHYPGTHWYHPHPHGATYDQVASGMAGFLIVEGPVDDYLKELYSSNEYLDLPLLIQRIFAPPPSPSEDDTTTRAPGKLLKGKEQKTKVIKPTVNGQSVTEDGFQVPTKQVVANQVIRLRVLNGSVDGQGYIRFMMVKGDPTNGPALLDPTGPLYNNSACIAGTMPKNASASAKRWCSQEDHGDFQCLNNIAFDGINLFNSDGNYTSMPVEWLSIGVANRGDFLIAIPSDAAVGQKYTIWAQDMTEAVDQQNLGGAPQNLKVAEFTVVSADNPLPAPTKNADGSLQIDWTYQGNTLKAEEMLMPIGVDEITIQDNSEQTTAYLPANPTTLDGTSFTMSSSNNKGKIRARRVLYSGFGHNSLASSANQSTKTVTAGDGTQVTENSLFNAMLIDGKKYGADTAHDHGWDTAQHKMQVNTAEEWTVYNYSMTVVETDSSAPSKPSSYVYGKSRYLQSSGNMKAKAVHHPFHIHQNPFYVRSLQDNEGNELLPLDENGKPIPRWQDTIYIPHNGGRVIFRSRFWDYTGKYVNHCHLLQHEDWGMMQAIEVVDGTTEKPNYLPLPAESTDTQNVFPPLSLAEMYTLDLGKVSEVLGSNALKMLCYDPSTTSFFNQKNITDMMVGSNPGSLIIPVPDDTMPYPQWNNELEEPTDGVA